MGKAPLMFKSGKKKGFNWRVLSIFIAFFLIAGSVKIFGLQNITGNLLMDNSWGEPGAVSALSPQPSVEIPELLTTDHQPPTTNKIFGTVQGLVVTNPSPGPPPAIPNPLFENGVWTTIGVYYNRTMPRSDSFQIVPVPNAQIISDSQIENYAPALTNLSGLSSIFTNQSETTFTIIAPGFLVNTHARKTVKTNTSAHFFLTLSKSKVSMQSHDRFVMGRSSNTTFTITTTLPDTVLPDHKQITDTLVDAVFIKEVAEKIYELSPHFQQKINLTEGTQQVSLNIEVPGALAARDLYLPKLWVKLLTSTDDMIHNKQEKVSIGFLEAQLNNSTITVTNPSSKKVSSILLSTELSNEKGEQLISSFSDLKYFT